MALLVMNDETGKRKELKNETGPDTTEGDALGSLTLTSMMCSPGAILESISCFMRIKLFLIDSRGFATFGSGVVTAEGIDESESSFCRMALPRLDNMIFELRRKAGGSDS